MGERERGRRHWQGSMADAKEEKAAVSTGEHLNIKVKQDENEIVFKIKNSTPLKKLMNAFCSRQAVEISQMVFLYDGQRVLPEETPAQLGMEDGDLIDAMLHQTGVKAPKSVPCPAVLAMHASTI